MARGGARPGAGRPRGSVSRMSAQARVASAATGELPHQFLLRVARGERICGHVPTFNERIDAAKAAAPYFAPRLGAQEVKLDRRTVRDLSDEELREKLESSVDEVIDEAARSGVLETVLARRGWLQVAQQHPLNSTRVTAIAFQEPKGGCNEVD